MTAFYVKTREAIQRLIREKRPRAYEPPPHPWTFEQIPAKDSEGNPNPCKQAAVFIVHGMGDQGFADTAIVFREGIEDTVDSMLEETPDANIPPPYISEGYWANYADFKAHFETEWKHFGEHERQFFEKLWKRRMENIVRTYFWLVRQLLRLCFEKKIRKKVKTGRWLGYFGMLPTGIVALTVIFFRHPSILSRVLSDVRVYLNPRGFIEASIVQRIDKRVGERFLRLIGLDWEFNPIQKDRQLTIGGEPHSFKYVTWIAHSLGSVVSYNVISDLLARCEEFKQKKIKLKEVKKVETALHRFITIGSPLEKIAVLYPQALRQWPSSSMQNFVQPKRRRWWTNFFHVLDPVSGVLLADQFSGYVQNFHSNVLRIPLFAHTSYWHDVPILSYVLSRTFGKTVVNVNPQFYEPENKGIKAMKILFFVVGQIIFIGVIIALVYFVLHYDRVMEWVSYLKGLL